MKIPRTELFYEVSLQRRDGYAAFDRRAGPGLPGAAVRAALPQHRAGDQCGRPARRRPDARQAQPGRSAVRVGEHGGRGLSNAGRRGVSGQPAPQRLLRTGIPGTACPDGRDKPAARAARGPCAGRAAGAIRPFHQRGGHPAVPGPDLGAAAKGTAVHLARPAGPRRPAGGNGAAAGAGGLSGGIPRGALRAGTDHRGGGHRTPAQPAGPAAAGAGGGGGPGLSPGAAGAGKQRPALPVHAGG